MRLHNILKSNLIVALAFATFVASSGTAHAQWTATGSVTSTSTETAVRPVVDSSGNVYTAGKSDQNAYVVKYNSLGSSQWLTPLTVSFPLVGLEPKAVAIAPSGDVYVAFRSQWATGPFPGGGGPGTRLTLRKFTSGGSQISSIDYACSSSATSPVAIAIDSFGNAYVTGVVSKSTGDEIFVAKFVSGSSFGWDYTYAGQGNASNTGNYPVGIAVTSTGDVMVGGASEGAMSNGDATHFTFLKLNPTTGAQIWLDQYMGSVYRKSGVSAAAFYNDTMYLTGTSRFTGSTDFDITVIAYNQSGTRTLEYVRTDSTVSDSSQAIAVNSSGVYVYGRLQTYFMGSPVIEGCIINAATGAKVIPNFGDFQNSGMSADANGFAFGGQNSSGLSLRRYSNAWSLSSSTSYAGSSYPQFGGVTLVSGAAYAAGATSTSSGADYFVIRF